MTGGIATGKSTVAKMFAELGVDIIDADLIAREVVEPGTVGWTRVRQAFGDRVLLEPEGPLDRTALASIIFGDVGKRQELNRIVHPLIYRNMGRKCLRSLFRGHPWVLLDLPLLYESGYMIPFLSKVIVVSCPEDMQLERLMKRNDLTREAAVARIGAQMALEEKCKKAHFVINNSGDIEETRDQAKAIHEQLMRSKTHLKVRFFVLVVVLLLLLLVYGVFSWFTCT
jgi:dephospho-CoA kinase